ncbi:MAG: hypothetical protein WAM30_13495, partial [Candidatus Dormiibacterota bacterium]
MLVTMPTIRPNQRQATSLGEHLLDVGATHGRSERRPRPRARARSSPDDAGTAQEAATSCSNDRALPRPTAQRGQDLLLSREVKTAGRQTFGDHLASGDIPTVDEEGWRRIFTHELLDLSLDLEVGQDSMNGFAHSIDPWAAGHLQNLDRGVAVLRDHGAELPGSARPFMTMTSSLAFIFISFRSDGRLDGLQQ